MKTILLLVTLLPLISFSQTKTTIANGDFYNPIVWDCFCLPASGDNLIINHDLIMNTDIYYTAGQILINANGSLAEDATGRDFWADGTANLTNQGDFTVSRLLFSPNAVFTNGGVANIVDSLFNQGVISNNGTVSVFDFLNDQTGTLTNFGTISILNNMNNQGEVNNQSNMDLGNDFSNCNTQTMDAVFNNDGIFCVTNNFSNCPDDTLKGMGDYYIGGSSTNLGVFDETFTFNTPSGTIGLPGTIAPGVTVTAGSCTLGLEFSDDISFEVFPNPTNSDIHFSITDVNYVLYDYSGKLISKGKIENYRIDFNNIADGLYTLVLEDYGTARFIKQNN
tara:strand:+ start:65250 stop:66257 length:1008 start_codon:yes stop_codon:yes gene_type:complete